MKKILKLTVASVVGMLPMFLPPCSPSHLPDHCSTAWLVPEGSTSWAEWELVWGCDFVGNPLLGEN